MKKGCKSCRYSVVENNSMICNFPLIAEKFPDGVIDENSTNTADDGIRCNRFEPKEKL